jgi:phosphoglycerol transferase MdoB-like AlkP superfamily enzyme
MTVLKNIPKHIKFIVSIYLLGLVAFTILRLLLFISSYHLYKALPDAEALSLIGSAFWMGVRFDTVISGYLLIVPLGLLLFISLFKIEKIFLYRILVSFIAVVYSLALLIAALDIPYFISFGNRLTMAMSSRLAKNSSFIFNMFFQEIRYCWVILPFLILVVLFIYFSNQLSKKILYPVTEFQSQGRVKFYAINIAASLLLVTLTIIGMRGRIAEKSPILVGTAYFSNYAFPNQLGLNPVFTLLRSFLDGLEPKNLKVNYMDGYTAALAAQKSLNRNASPNPQFILSKSIAGMANPVKPNIVLVIMESMAAAKMGHFDASKKNTPCLDKLANEGLCFENIYSAGIHTFNGIYGTIFSHPALKSQHPMELVTIPKFAGLATSLKLHDYQTCYFTTHDDQFDGVAGFLQHNDYEKIISQKDYPTEKVLSTLGVADDYMFETSIAYLNEMANQQKPFMATYMTASDHGPYMIPSYYERKYPAGQEDQEAIGYADWSIGRFLESASKQVWFDHTIFIFIADHGSSSLDGTYELSYTANHVPLIIYAPKLIQRQQLNQMGCQIDVFPTIMGLTGLSYVNNTLGVDLLHEKRPYAYFSADDKYGVKNDEWYLIVREDGHRGLYKYRNKEVNNLVDSHKVLADDMQKYAETMFQTSQWMIDHQQTAVK